MCWIFFGQRFGHAFNIGFVDLLRSGALQRAKSYVYGCRDEFDF